MKQFDWFMYSDITISNDDIRRLWENDGFRVFLSHKSQVKKETADLKDRLKMYGVTCFVAHQDIEPTLAWQNEIEKSLFSMNALVALISEDFHDSDWTDQEVGVAFGRMVPIVTAGLGGTPRGFINKYQALPCTWESAAEEIVKILIKNDEMVDAYINMVKNSDSYAESNILSKILPSISNLSEPQISNLISAFNENAQVHNSVGFNEEKPSEYGNGLVYHLNRVTENLYEYTADNMIRIQQ